MLFLQFPVGTGWSFGQKYAKTSEELGAEFVFFLQNLFEEHPGYQGREIILTGTDNASSDIAVAAKSVQDYNSGLNHQTKFNLKSVILNEHEVKTDDHTIQSNEMLSIGM